VSTTTDSNPPPDTSTAASFSEGQILAGCYALSRRLDAGAGHEVWLASDEVLGKEVTLHFLPAPVINDSLALQELRQEVKKVRQLIHPNILRVYDLIEDTGCAAISMSAFEGESTAVRLAKQPEKRFAASEIEPWVYQLAQTIDDAHRINVLHRGLVPENIFLTGNGQLLVASFGISRVVQDALGRAGVADVGRVAYSSPQILEGTPPARTDDVFSLGAVLYTLLVGAPPFTGGDVAAQVRAGVTPEALAVLGKEDLHIPPAWRNTITSALQKTAENRPPTAGEFLRGLKEAGDAPATIRAPKELPADIPPPVILPPPAKEPLDLVIEPAPTPERTKSKRTIPLPEKTAEPVRLEVVKPPVEPAPKPAQGEKIEEPNPFKSTPEPKRVEPEKALPAAKTEPPRAPSKPKQGEFIPRLYPEEPKLPVVWIAALIGLLLLSLIIYHFVSSGKKESGSETASATPVPEQTELRDLSHTPAPATVVTNSSKPAAPSAPTPDQIAAQAALAEAQKAADDKQAALDAAKAAAQSAEKTQTDLAQQQAAAEAAVADVQKSLAEKTKASEAAKSTADEAAAQQKKFDEQQKKLEDDQKAAEAAVAEAQKAAAEKARLADEGKKSLSDLAKKSEENAVAQQKATEDLEAARKALADKQKAASDAAKAAADAAATQKQASRALADAQKAVEAAVAALADSQKKLAALGGAKPETASTDQLQNPKDKAAQVKTPEKPATPAIAPAATPAPSTPLAAVATPAPTPEMKLALNTTPIPTMPFAKPGGNGPGNSLGMKFVPVGDVDFSIFLTRVKDFEVFAKAVNLKSNSWKSPGFVQAPDHPVVNVTWIEAIAFCTWLTSVEHKDGTLPANQIYRLPTDLEWSKAVGLPDETGKTPEARDMGVPEVYPWGTSWPPPPGAGNYTGEETGSDVAIKGYDDGYAWTSPVGAFKPNKYGLYDMGGNVWQWCMDNWNPESKAKVLRGASWYNGALKLSLLSSCRVHAAPDSSTDNYGFRVVRATDTVSKTVKKPELR
jgi:serine/threonine protein kinase/formylglycine-generating enzyme required for sulfatase activity